MLHSTTPDAMREGGAKAACFVQIPMNQYQDERSIDNLIGPPVGILGEGQLTGALRKCPSAVVLLDEFEKAHPRVSRHDVAGIWVAFFSRCQRYDRC